jgi:peptidoglycan/LPS O-acetylase OafA/YrhL
LESPIRADLSPLPVLLPFAGSLYRSLCLIKLRQDSSFFLAVATLGLNLAMLQAWDIAIRGDWNHPSWSMSAEAFFYLLFPFLGVKLWEKSKYWNIPIALIICYLVLMAPMLIYGVFGINAAFNNNNFPGIFLRFSPLFRPPEFALGILLMRLHHKILKDPRPKAMVANLFFWGGLAGALAGFYFSEQFRPSFLFGGVYDPFLAAILLGAALSQGFIASILSNKTLVLLGEASYGIYILQSPVGSWFWACLKLFSKTRPGGIEPLIPYPLSFFCYIVTLILVSVVTYLYLEKPLRIKIRNMNFGFLTQKSGQTR